MQSPEKTSNSSVKERMSEKLEQVRQHREEIQNEIIVEEEEKQQIEKDLISLQKRLDEIKKSLKPLHKMKKDFDFCIKEGEHSLAKIAESS